MRTILVNGIGCVESGARLVLEKLLSNPPNDSAITAIVPETFSRARVHPSIRLLVLKHHLWGRFLRPLLEFAVGLAAVTGHWQVVNVSNYGVCLGGEYTLYIHNALLFKEDESVSGKWLKRWMLRTCFSFCTKVFVQTQQFKELVTSKGDDLGILHARLAVLAPGPIVGKQVTMKRSLRRFGYQLVYPCSRFEHKRVGLAIDGCVLARRRVPEIGLVLTSDASASTEVDGLLCTGPLEHNDALELVQASDAVLFTSRTESLGLPLLEAIELAKPCIAPALPYATEILGAAGRYFDFPTAECVADAIVSLYAERSLAAERAVQYRDSTRKARTSWKQHWVAFLPIHRTAGVI